MVVTLWNIRNSVDLRNQIDRTPRVKVFPKGVHFFCHGPLPLVNDQLFNYWLVLLRLNIVQIFAASPGSDATANNVLTDFSEATQHERARRADKKASRQRGQRWKTIS